MDWLKSSLGRARELLDVAVISMGDTRITLWSLLYLTIFVVLLLWGTRRIQRWLTTGPLLRTRLDAGARQAAGAIARYVLLLIGMLIVVQTAGINLTAFTVIAGAVGIGVGFGLQNIVANFIAGLIIMFERPVKIGDRIVVDDVAGDVIEVGARATVVLTNDNIAIIVPNSKFITENVVNWKYIDDRIRFHVPVSVAYGSDPRQVEQVLLEVAKEVPEVLDYPAPAVRLQEFGDNGILFELLAWSSSLMHRRGRMVSTLNFMIHEKFTAAGIQFPFPQRDIHIRSGVLAVRRAAKEDHGD